MRKDEKKKKTIAQEGGKRVRACSRSEYKLKRLKEEGGAELAAGGKRLKGEHRRIKAI